LFCVASSHWPNKWWWWW